MPSRNFNVRLPENLEKALFECINESEATNFFRAAIAEKLNRDFGKNVEIEKMVRGMRNDMKTEAGRAAAEENLRRARDWKEVFTALRREIQELPAAVQKLIPEIAKHRGEALEAYQKLIPEIRKRREEELKAYQKIISIYETTKPPKSKGE